LNVEKDLFSANVFRDPHATALFYKFISSLHRLCASDEVQPTATHHFVSKLARRGKLLRYYTQNIDCLEDEVGLTQALDLHSSSGSSSSSSGASKRFNGHCVQLHGRIDRVKCGCGYVGDWSDDVLAEMSEGFAPSCPGCDERADVRRSLRKRSIKQVGHMGALKPAITLYDDAPSPDEHTIAAISDSDLRRKPDLVLVLGTSLKIPGFKNLVKDFVFQARQRSGKQNVRAVLINATDVLSTEWKGVFDYFGAFDPLLLDLG
jgi:NAD-dependent histone deacetylase SIR2